MLDRKVKILEPCLRGFMYGFAYVLIVSLIYNLYISIVSALNFIIAILIVATMWR
jgi:hypothetical protein